MRQVDPFEIIEEQLQRIKEQSDKHLLTVDEINSFAMLVKVKMLLKTKGSGTPTEDPYPELTADELRNLLPGL